MSRMDELEKCMDALESEMERLKAFSEYLAMTDDYKMMVPSDTEDIFLHSPGREVPIDAFLIAKHLSEYVAQLSVKYKELKDAMHS